MSTDDEELRAYARHLFGQPDEPEPEPDDEPLTIEGIDDARLLVKHLFTDNEETTR